MGVTMQHDWIIEVLTDLQTYAERNGLAGTAAQAAEAMRIARLELAAMAGQEAPPLPLSRRRQN